MNERKTKLEVIKGQISDRRMQNLALHYAEGLDDEEIAKRLGYPNKKAAWRARNRAKEITAKWFTILFNE